MSKTWPMVPLGEILIPVSRPEVVDPQVTYHILGAHWYATGLYTKEIKQGAQIQASRLYRVEKGDFVYNRLFAWKGSFAVATAQNHGCYVSNEFPCFTVKSDHADGRYLWRYFSRAVVWEEALGLSSGGTPTSRNRLKEEKLLAMRIPLPPLPEQRRIVARIEELAAKIKEARGLRRQAVEEGGALVYASARRLLSKVGAELTELRYWLDRDRDGVQTGPFGAQLGSHDFVDTGVPLLTIGNVQYSGLELSNLKYVSEEKAQQLNRYAVRTKDLLFARMGTVGRCCVVPEQAEGWLINYHIIRVALDQKRIDPHYVHWAIRASADVEKYLNERIRGATRQGVNSEIVASLPCRVPPLPEQRHIVAYLDDLQAKVDALKRLQAETAAELDALLPSVLDKAFRGEL
jgi:type I restriction enzyme S subunit